MPDTGNLIFTSMVDTGVNTPWINPGNAKVSDNVYATNTTGSGTLNKLKGTGINLPVGSRLSGIAVSVERRLDAGPGNSGSPPNNQLFLVVANVEVGNLKDLGAWPGVEGATVFGGQGDFWGSALEQPFSQSIDLTTFGVTLAPPILSDISVDAIQMNIHYSAPMFMGM